MKQKKEFCLIEGTIYPFDIVIATAKDEDVFKYIEKKGRPLTDEEKEIMRFKQGTNGKTIQLSTGQIIIRLKKVKTITGLDIAILAHEIEHACFMLFERIGLTHTAESDEAYAYHQEYLMRKVLMFFQ